jgi:protein-S-isoprenylcysteine O-methyltransferase Ste14
MLYLPLAIIGFLIICLADPTAVGRLPYLKPILWVAGLALIAYSAVQAALWPDKLMLPHWTQWAGWALFSVTLCLTIYGLTINLPFRKTYIASGLGDRLVTTGLYALVRHPWVHLSIVMIIALVLISASRLLLLASPAILLTELVSVWIQDRFFFGKMFPGYDKYRQTTPMIIPNRGSIKAFLNSNRERRHPKRWEGAFEKGEDSNVNVG